MSKKSNKFKKDKKEMKAKKSKGKMKFKDKKKAAEKMKNKHRGAAENNKFKQSLKKLRELPLKERMMERLKASRFRFMNEQLYVMKSKEALQYFKKNKEAFAEYHEGFKQQVQNWPINPLEIVIKSLQCLVNSRKDLVIADFGCGEAQLAKSLPQTKVHSFDLVSLDPVVTVCDMAKTPLKESSVDVVVFCLSLMGTNLVDYLIEANRVLKIGGVLKIAEVESRFENIDHFIKTLSRFGFSLTSKNFSHDLFYFMDYKKNRNLGKHFKKKVDDLKLKPCLYKKR